MSQNDPKQDFAVFVPETDGTYAAQLSSLEAQLDAWLARRGWTTERVFMARLYLSDAANQLADFRAHGLCAKLSGAGFSYIEQPLLSGHKAALQVWAVKAEDAERKVLPDGLLLEWRGGRMVFQTVRFSAGEARGTDALEQTRMAFARHGELLRSLGMNLRDHCQRTWIYVRDIDRHYAGVVKGRNEVFADEGLTADTHFIASTGIGGYTDHREAVVAMDFLSVADGKGMDVRYLSATDYLNPTAEYGVAFERGTALTLFGTRYRFISGTASIDRHGECLYRGDVAAQTERLFLNIEKLLEADGSSLADMAYMVVYLRDVADCAWVSRYIAARFPSVPHLITEARVCRPEWLIEVECIACAAAE